MPSTYQSPDYPNVLVIYGDDVFDSPYRARLLSYLQSADTEDSPVRPGTHSLWVTYSTPSQGDGNYQGLSDPTHPHPLHGVIRMGPPPSPGDDDAMQRHLRVLLQEAGHRWLVPSDFGFKSDGRTTKPLTQDKLLDAINGDSLGGQLAIVGRDDSHWSVYFRADGSPVDGQDWQDMGRDGIFDHWKWVAQSGPRVSADGLDEIELLGTYNDLDLAIMGVIKPENAYPGSGGRLRWMDTRLTAPLGNQSGVIVAYNRNDMIYFGFEQDQRQLAVVRTGSDLTGTLVARTRVHAQLLPPTGVLLRVIRKGNDLHFQARADRTVGLHLSPEPRDLGALAPASRAATIPGLFDAIDAPAAASADAELDDWRTVAKVSDSRQPQAVGLMVRKWQADHLCEAAFFNLELQAGGQHTVHRFERDSLTSLGGGPLSDAPSDKPVRDFPNDAAWARYAGDRVLFIGAPFAGKGSANETINYSDGAMTPNGFGHSKTIDHAPKVIVRAPVGDFAFGTAAMMRRTIMTPQAAGDARDREMWGHARSIQAADLDLGDGPTRAQLRVNPATLPCAFIVVAKTQSDGEALLKAVDGVRRYWENTMAAATRGVVKMPTGL
jgi:hypothetical protein